MGRRNCTALLLEYRQMARWVWNTGFWPNDDLRTAHFFVVGDYVAAFDEAMAMLYEGMVLLPLGYSDRVRDLNSEAAGRHALLPFSKCSVWAPAPEPR